MAETLERTEATPAHTAKKSVWQLGRPWLYMTVRSTLLDKMTGDKQAEARSMLEQEMDLMRHELEGPDPTPIESLLAEQATLCYAGLRYFELLYYAGFGRECSLKQDEHRLRRIAGAQARFQSALRTLAHVRRLQLPSVQV